MNDYKLTEREELLISRGYNYQDVVKLCNFDSNTLDYIVNMIFEDIKKDCKMVENPVAIFIGGQPGSGKSIKSYKVKKEFDENGIIIVSLDNYRSYHPNYSLMEDLIKKHWEGRVETVNDSMGNDIADFTHYFASVVSDKISSLVSRMIDNKGYNLIFDWGMRMPLEPLKVMEELHQKGYRNEVMFVIVHESVSRDACKLRLMYNNKHILRRVCDDFHDLCVSTLPDSAKTIYQVGIEKRIIDKFCLIDRNDHVLWDTNSSNDLKSVYYNHLHDNIYNTFTNNLDDIIIICNLESKGFK
ncbi:MAG: zeta toxin family protein [Bacilli bacterium]|nr:zeta toxin family protein [Bacilli bacterium]